MILHAARMRHPRVMETGLHPTSPEGKGASECGEIDSIESRFAPERKAGGQDDSKADGQAGPSRRALDLGLSRRDSPRQARRIPTPTPGSIPVFAEWLEECGAAVDGSADSEKCNGEGAALKDVGTWCKEAPANPCATGGFPKLSSYVCSGSTTSSGVTPAELRFVMSRVAATRRHTTDDFPGASPSAAPLHIAILHSTRCSSNRKETRAQPRVRAPRSWRVAPCCSRSTLRRLLASCPRRRPSSCGHSPCFARAHGGSSHFTPQS